MKIIETETPYDINVSHVQGCRSSFLLLLRPSEPGNTEVRLKYDACCEALNTNKLTLIPLIILGHLNS